MGSWEVSLQISEDCDLRCMLYTIYSALQLQREQPEHLHQCNSN